MTDLLVMPHEAATEPERAGPAGKPPRPSPGGWWAISSAIAVVALIFGMIGLITPRRGGAIDSGAPAGPPQPFAVSLSEFAVQPNRIEVEAGRPVVLTVTNQGTMAHDLKVDGLRGTALLQPGASQEINIGAVSAMVMLWCTVPGHRASGMELTVVVKGTPPAASGSESGSAASSVKYAAVDPAAVPAATWKPFDPALAPAPGATVHDITFHATEKVIEVAPGVTQNMWTFNDQVPGPILRGHVGDLFNVTLVNDGSMGHSIDFHASRVAWNDKMRTINPGESLVYQYRADYAGIFMYHCGTAPALHHIGNGMYGAVIIDPPGLAPVDHEYVMVQSELYFGPQGEPGDLTKMQKEAWDAVVFNGYVNQYKFAPIRVEPDQRVRVWVLDAGPSENSSFHVVGTIFDTVFKEGEYLLRPSATHGGSQTLDLQAAQGGFVEFSFAEVGLYPIVTHKFANVGKGALGLFQAGDVVVTGAGH